MFLRNELLVIAVDLADRIMIGQVAGLDTADDPDDGANGLVVVDPATNLCAYGVAPWPVLTRQELINDHDFL